MKSYVVLFLISCSLLLSACQAAEPVCSPGSITYLNNVPPFPEPTQSIETDSAIPPAEIEIGGKIMAFNQVIHGPLCNNTLSGTVYVACDIQVAEWTSKPDFLNNCNFSVEPGTVIYVAAHNNAAYHKGCASCHGGNGGTEN